MLRAAVRAIARSLVLWPVCALYLIAQSPTTDPSVPHIASIEPAAAYQGGPVTVTIEGTGFVQSETTQTQFMGWFSLPMMLSGTAHVVDDHTMTVDLTLKAPPGTYYVGVANVTHGQTFSSVPSNNLPFTVLPSVVPSMPQYTTTVLAGPRGGPGSVDGWGASAKFWGISGLWGSGNSLYITDATTVRQIDTTSGLVSTIAGEPHVGGINDDAGRNARFNSPSSVWANGSTVYLADGTSLRTLNLATTQVSTVSQSVDPGPSLWSDGTFIYSARNRTILRGRLDTLQMLPWVQLTAVTSDPHEPLAPPYVTGDGRYLYVSDTGSVVQSRNRNVILKIDLQTQTTTIIAGQPFESGAADGPGNLATFKQPAGLWTNGQFLFVSDSGNQIIRQIDLATNEVTTIAGSALQSDFRDGIGTDARFRSPRLIWGDGSSLYVSDISAIRRITIATGEVTTLAGSGFPTGTTDGTASQARFVGLRGLWNDGSQLFSIDYDRIRQTDTSTGETHTVAVFPDSRELSSLWGDGPYLFTFGAQFDQQAQNYQPAVRRIERATGAVSIVALVGPRVFSWYALVPIWGEGSNVYVSIPSVDTTIYKVNLASGQYSAFAKLPDFSPVQALWGDQENLYAASIYTIHRISLASGQLVQIAGMREVPSFPYDGPADQARFAGLQSIFGDGRFLYVIDRDFYGSRIRKVDPASGEVSTIAGAWGISGTEEGLGQATRLLGPLGVSGDGENLYVADIAAIRKLSLSDVSSKNFRIDANAVLSLITTATSSAVTVGYAKIDSQSGSAIAGAAVYSYRQNGVLVSETGVPAVPAISRGRIFTDVEPNVRTGIAITNPNAQPAVISFKFTDATGTDSVSGSFTLPPNSQIARFLDEPPFNTIPAFPASRTLTFEAAQPVAAVALRGFINERSEFLMTTLPVVDLSKTSSGPIVFPHFADGGGWSSKIVLTNPTDAPETGSGMFVASDGHNLSSFNYTIPARSAILISTPGTGETISTGQVRITPASGQTAPAGVLIFSFVRYGITVSAASVPAVSGSADILTYAEMTGSESGLAVANTSEAPLRVTIGLTDLLGNSAAPPATMDLPPRGQRALFLREIPEFASLLAPFQGSLHLTADAPAIGITALRGAYNERGDFLISTLPVVDLADKTNGSLIVPHMAVGAGYTTQLIFFNASGASPVTATIEFFSQSGQPQLLKVQ